MKPRTRLYARMSTNIHCGDAYAQVFRGSFDSGDLLVFRSAADGARRSATERSWPTLHDRVLLQGAVGASAGVPRSLSQESLSSAEADCRDGAHVVGEDRSAGVSHDRRRAVGLPGDDSLQEFDGGHDG